jgi:hypothetical protein
MKKGRHVNTKLMKPSQIAELAQAVIDAKTQRKAQILKEKLIAGFYPQPPDRIGSTKSATK